MHIKKLPVEGFEGVWRAEDPSRNFLAFIAIHSTKRGPALGGVRFWSYDSEEMAVSEVKRLAEQMTYKAAIADVATGGGKGIIVKPRGDYDRKALLQAFAEFINSFQGDYITAKDAGTTSEDMSRMHQDCQWVTGLPLAEGGAGDPSPMTALGVVSSIRVAIARALNRTSFTGLRVTIQGLGSVGADIARQLCSQHANVWASDVDAGKVSRYAQELGLHPILPEMTLSQETDLLVPCALGPVVTQATVSQLQCRVIVGAANDQLEAPESMSQRLADQGILYAPDFVVNAGGLVHVAEEWFGYDKTRTRRRCEHIGTTLAEIFERSSHEDVTPYAAAVEWAHELLAI